MQRYVEPDFVISGVGVTSAVGQGKEGFCRALMDGRHAFDVMRRPGRQRDTAFLGAEIEGLVLPTRISKRTLRFASLSAQVALATLDEAWRDAKLEAEDPTRIGLIVGGSNTQQRELAELRDGYATRPAFVTPRYALAFMDTDICGICTEQFGIRGIAHTVGGASASGQLAVIQAVQAVQAGEVDVCIALGALMDLSFWECQALRSLGAMGSDRYASEPSAACRPFDMQRDGFIFGESCGVLVIERRDRARARGAGFYAQLLGWSVVVDGSRDPDPSLEGEIRVITSALAHARLSASEVDYVNPHGSGSVLGDETELAAIRASGLSHAYINSTKSITGHGLSAAGAVELIATSLQMRERRLHPSRNMTEPIDPFLNWVGPDAAPYVVNHALNLSIGFAGINTAVCLRRED